MWEYCKSEKPETRINVGTYYLRKQPIHYDPTELKNGRFEHCHEPNKESSVHYLALYDNHHLTSRRIDKFAIASECGVLRSMIIQGWRVKSYYNNRSTRLACVNRKLSQRLPSSQNYCEHSVLKAFPTELSAAKWAKRSVYLNSVAARHLESVIHWNKCLDIVFILKIVHTLCISLRRLERGNPKTSR